MRMARRLRSLLLAVTVASLVVACLPVAPSPSPTPTPVRAPAAAPVPGQAVVVVDSNGNQQGGSSNAFYVNPLALNSASDSVSIESTRNTYASTFALTPAVTSGADFLMLASSSTLVDRLIYAAFYPECTAQALVTVQVVQRSTLDTGGTQVVEPLRVRNQANAASTSTLTGFTAIPGANGTFVGTVDLAVGTGLVTTTTTSPTPIVFDYTKGQQQPPTLRANGTDMIGFDFPATACTGVTFPAVVIVWTEAAS